MAPKVRAAREDFVEDTKKSLTEVRLGD